MKWLRWIGLFGYIIVTVLGYPQSETETISALTLDSTQKETLENPTENPVQSSEEVLVGRGIKKKPIKVSVKTKKDDLTSDFGTFSPTSFENKLPFDGKETEESSSEEDDYGDFFYDEIEELAPPVINAFTKRPSPPYKLEEDQYEDDYYADDLNYADKDDEGDEPMSFTSFFMDLFYELFARFASTPAEDDDDEYYDENNYAARKTTPRGLAYRKVKRPSYNQFLSFYEENDNRLESKTNDEEKVESKWLSWFDGSESESSKDVVEATTLPMTTTTTSTETSWGLFDIFNNKNKPKRSPTTATPIPPTTTPGNLPALISALSERFASPSTAAPTEVPLATPTTQKSYRNYQLWRLKPINEEHLNALNAVRLYEPEYQWWQGPTLEGKTDVLVPPDKIDEFREMLGEEEIKYMTTIRDLDMAIRFSNPQIPRSESFQLEAIQGHPMTWHRYHRYADMMKYFEYLHRKYPKNVDLLHIGRTFEGRPIVVCHIYERPEKKIKRKKQSIFVESGMRGHEWIGPAVATWILENLSRNNFRLTNRTLDGVLLSREWFILPVANPDGYEYSHTTDRLWTKNRSRKKKTSVGFFSNFFSLAWFTRGNADQEDLSADEECLGVDLGRNFDYRWNRDTNINSRSLCGNDYAGTRPFSESETRALAKFLIKIAPTLKLYISLQSYGQLISLPPSKLLPLERFEAIESAENAVNSLRRFGLPLVKYFVDEDASQRDSVAGSSDGFVTRELEIKRAFTIKLRDTGENGFLLPPSYIETTARETFEMIKILVDDLRRKD